MKRKTAVYLCVILLLMAIAVIYEQTIGAPVIGSISGAEWECLTVDGTKYEIDYAAPVNRTDKGAFLGIATNGDVKFRIYSIKKYDEYLYCQWEWEGHIYRRVH